MGPLLTYARRSSLVSLVFKAIELISSQINFQKSHNVEIKLWKRQQQPQRIHLMARWALFCVCVLLVCVDGS